MNLRPSQVAVMAVALAAPISAAEQPSLADQVAAALARADVAARKGDRSGLSRALIELDVAGAHPLEATAPDPVVAWRSRAMPAKVVLRGRALGPAYRSGRLAGNTRDSLAQLFLSGRDASVALSAPEGGRLAMTVRDKDERPVCRGETGSFARNGCRWVPLYTQRYTIEVTNLGARDTTYFLVID